MPTISADQLQTFATQLLNAGGMELTEATRLAKSLVGANQRGYDSHGVMRIPYYVDMIAKGDMAPGTPLEILNETDSLLVVDAQWGIGQTQAMATLDKLIAKAKESGVAVGTIRCCGHIGRLGEYVETTAGHGLIGMAMVNTHGAVHRVAPPGGIASRLGTNPLAIGVPNEEAPMILDFSTSATAEGKVRVKHIAGETVPDGWLIDSEGNPTNDPGKLYRDPPGCIVPMGGVQAYKGFGLALMVEILTGALSGGLCSREIAESPKGNCVFFLVLDPEKFGGAEHFAKEVAQLEKFMRSCPTVEGVDGVTLPGDPERRVMQQRNQDGLPFDDENWKALVELGERLGVESPA